jgi:hypothetical protein
MTRLRRSLIALSTSTVVLLSACGGPLEQAGHETGGTAPAVQGPATGVPEPWVPSPPVGAPKDELPGGYGWSTWGDCTDSLAC